RVVLDRVSQARFEPLKVHSAIAVRDGVREALNILGVRICVLEDNVDITDFRFIIDHEFPHSADDDRFRMDKLLGFTELLDVFADAFLVNEGLFSMRFRTFVDQVNLESMVEEGEFPHTVCENIELELGCDRKDFRVRQKRDQSSGMLLVLDLADNFQFAARFAADKRYQIDFTVPRHLGFEPFRESVNALCTYAMEPTRKFVRPLPEFTARMQVGEDELNRRHLKFRMHFDRNSAPIVANGDRAVDMDSYIDARAKPGEMFVNRVIENLKNAVVQAALIRISNVHSGPFSNRLQALEFVNLRSAVIQDFSHIRETGLSV